MERFEPLPVEKQDVSQSFATMEPYDFSQFLRTLRTVKRLELRVDLSSITDQTEFKIQARRVKAFLEDPSKGLQERAASIKATEEQRKWESNVFSSGVELVIS